MATTDGRPYSLTLVIEKCPESLNRILRMRRGHTSSLKKEWHSIIWELVKYQRPEIPLTKAQIYFERQSHRMLDYDGLCGSLKPLADGLVNARILADDSWNVLGPWRVNQTYRPKKDGQRIVIELTEIRNPQEQDTVSCRKKSNP